MVRIRPNDFLDRLIAAGLEVFGTKGFSQSRMSDVANVMGVSQGTLYNYVESKEALFGLLVERGADPEPVELPSELPIPAIPDAELAGRLTLQARRTFALPRLDHALTLEVAEDPRSELSGIIEELWKTTSNTRGHADALERSVRHLPREVQVAFFGFRRQLFERFAHYVGSRMQSGQFAYVGSPVVAARFLIETITLFARHRYHDPDPGTLPDDPTVRTAITALLLNSFVPFPEASE